jgi:hypothetical protein
MVLGENLWSRQREQNTQRRKELFTFEGVRVIAHTTKLLGTLELRGSNVEELNTTDHQEVHQLLVFLGLRARGVFHGPRNHSLSLFSAFVFPFKLAREDLVERDCVEALQESHVPKTLGLGQGCFAENQR